MDDQNRKAMFSKLKKGQLRGKTYRRKSRPVIIDYRKKLALSPKGRRIGRFKSTQIR